VFAFTISAPAFLNGVFHFFFCEFQFFGDFIHHATLAIEVVALLAEPIGVAVSIYILAALITTHH
jgi:hypothetical protein